MPFRLRTRVGSRNHLLDRVEIPHGKGQFWGGWPILKYRDTLQWSVQKWINQSRCRLSYGLSWAQGIVNRWAPDPPWEVAILRGEKGPPIVKYSNSLPWAVQKRLKLLGCRLGFELEWAQGSMYRWWCTLPLCGKYHWTVQMQLRCSLLSNYFDHLLMLIMQWRWPWVWHHIGHSSQTVVYPRTDSVA